MEHQTCPMWSDITASFLLMKKLFLSLKTLLINSSMRNVTCELSKDESLTLNYLQLQCFSSTAHFRELLVERVRIISVLQVLFMSDREI